MMADYHIHTRLCRHAEGEPLEYVERAISLGMTEMGFADHLPFLNGWSPGYGIPDDDWAMGVDELDDTERVLSDYPFEYVIGSVHLVGDGFAFDHPDVGDRLPRYGIDRVFLESLELVAKGIPPTFGSDAHRPADVGYEFPRAAAEARAAGYSSRRRLDGPPKDLS